MALMIAVKRKDEENITKVVKLGAVADKADTSGISARDIAIQKGPRRRLRYL